MGGKFHKESVRTQPLRGKKVLLRADFNVPLNSTGTIKDDYRIKQSLETINFLREHHAKIIIISHLGRPKGTVDINLSLAPVAKRLQELLNHEVAFAEDCIGGARQQAVKDMNNGDILLLENLRFHKEEKANNDLFAQSLAEDMDLFVQDGFGVVHRAHASTDAITSHLNSVAGLLLEKEYTTITQAMESPDRPLAAVIGGAKISDKIDILHRFIDIADFVAVGGAMANTFLAAQGVKIGDSLYEKDAVSTAKEILAKANIKSTESKFEFFLPQDGVVAKGVDAKLPTRIVDWWSHTTADIISYPKTAQSISYEVQEDELILDIGPYSAAYIAGALRQMNTVIWNGPVGVTEVGGMGGKPAPFAHGSRVILDSLTLATKNPFTVIGGGDTASYVLKAPAGVADSLNHISTGGGASLELMSGKKLPGVEALVNSK